ncbi:MAG: hypothetical protein ACTSXY_12360 [Promethearchaeota archaeon]
MTAPLITNATVNVTGMYSMFQYVAEVSSMFFPLILFGLFIILFVILRSNSNSNSTPFAVSSFFTMVLSIMFRTLGFIQNKWMYISITIMAASVVWIHLDNSQS